jgi:hypothetical protein
MEYNEQQRPTITERLKPVSECWYPLSTQSYYRDKEVKVLVKLNHYVIIKEEDAPSFRKGDQYINHDGVEYKVRSVFDGKVYLDGVVGFNLGDRLANTPYLILAFSGSIYEEDGAYE